MSGLSLQFYPHSKQYNNILYYVTNVYWAFNSIKYYWTQIYTLWIYWPVGLVGRKLISISFHWFAIKLFHKMYIGTRYAVFADLPYLFKPNFLYRRHVFSLLFMQKRTVYRANPSYCIFFITLLFIFYYIYSHILPYCVRKNTKYVLYYHKYYYYWIDV